MIRYRASAVLVTAAVVALVACNSDNLSVPNYNSPTPGGLAGDPVAGVQLSANGILFQARSAQAGFNNSSGILGRESYNYTPTEGRSTSCWLNIAQDNNCGAGAAFWGTYYTQARNVFNFLNTIEASTGLTDAQKEGARGYAKTFEAHGFGFVAERGVNGGPVEVLESPKAVAPFVTRDSLYNFIIGRLDQAKTHLLAGGATFVFTIPGGFAGFNTPATFLKFNRALAARYNAERASFRVAGCGANGVTCYQLVLQNLSESFLDASNLNLGPMYLYSTASGDATNGLSNGSSPFVFAHASIKSDAPLRPDGSRDLRYQNKIVTIPVVGTGSAVPGATTDQDFKIFSAQTDPIGIIRSEELVLLRAEARWFTGDKVGALADINVIRTTSGGLAPTSLTAANSDADFITELLLQRRYSLLEEGHRWIDVRRFGRLSTLPIDVPSHGVYQDLLIPQSECLARAGIGTKPPTCP
ncbi:MAG: RagB/SusD family nutrient uptake outer membrane protein [Gemmatimonadaceae bacterium]